MAERLPFGKKAMNWAADSDEEDSSEDDMPQVPHIQKGSRVRVINGQTQTQTQTQAQTDDETPSGRIRDTTPSGVAVQKLA